MIYTLNNEDETKAFGRLIGSLLSGGEIIELVGDVGSGKTTITKGLAIGLNIDEYIQSPSFTINRAYKARDDIVLTHYDFYRLNDAGIMADELAEVLSDRKTITVIEWAEAIKGILPDDRIIIKIDPISDNSRKISIECGGNVSKKIIEAIKL